MSAATGRPGTRRGLLIAAVLLVALLAALAWTRRGGSDTDMLVLYGNVDIREVQLAFRQPGRVLEMNFNEGDAVQAGDHMATLDPQPFTDALAGAEAAVRVAQA